MFAALLVAFEGSAATYYALQVRGDSRIYAADAPVRKGRVYLFHRYPDGIYMSLAASEVEKVLSLSEPPPPEGLAPGQALYVGGAVEGPGFAPPPMAPPAGPADLTMDSGYGYYGSYWGGGGGYVPPPRPAPPSHIGPNGYPILAPPGSPGSTPPPIGPNGFPVLSPPPAPAPAPRRPR